MPPPNVVPVNAGWNLIEEEVGFSLPSDYKEFIDAYGTGCISNFIWVFNPFSQNKALNNHAVQYHMWAYQDLKSNYPEHYPIPNFPNEGSFYPWGGTDNGDCLAWEVKGDPSRWTVILIGSGGHKNVDYCNLNMSEFLYELLTGGLSGQLNSIDTEEPFEPVFRSSLK